MSKKVWDGMYYDFPKFNGCTISLCMVDGLRNCWFTTQTYQTGRDKLGYKTVKPLYGVCSASPKMIPEMCFIVPRNRVLL